MICFDEFYCKLMVERIGKNDIREISVCRGREFYIRLRERDRKIR